MWPSQRLMFYTSPVTRGRRASLLFWLGVWVGVCVVAPFFIPSNCVYSPIPNASFVGDMPVCTTTDKTNALTTYIIFVAIALLVIGVCAVVSWVAPDRYLALTVTARGLASDSSRFPHGMIGWSDIESLTLYRDIALSSAGHPVSYLAVMVHSPEGMHDSEAIELVWRQYPRVPEMDRVALMLRLERPSDASGKKITAADVIERIQICFPGEIAQHGVEVVEDMRLV